MAWHLVAWGNQLRDLITQTAKHLKSTYIVTRQGAIQIKCWNYYLMAWPGISQAVGGSVATFSPSGEGLVLAAGGG